MLNKVDFMKVGHLLQAARKSKKGTSLSENRSVQGGVPSDTHVGQLEGHMMISGLQWVKLTANPAR
jgi:hypothetical protein